MASIQIMKALRRDRLQLRKKIRCRVTRIWRKTRAMRRKLTTCQET